MQRNMLKVVLIALFAGSGMITSSQAQYWQGPDDLPTWNVGDQWDLERTFTIHLGGSVAVDPLVLYLDVPITIHDRYTLEMTTTDTLAVNNGLGAFSPTVAYVRRRVTGSMDVSLENNRIAIIPGFQEPYVTLTGGITAADSSQGYNWTSVGDLSQIREAFTMPEMQGSLQIIGVPPQPSANLICFFLPSLTNSANPANGIKCGDTVPFFLSLDISIDHETHATGTSGASGLELIDFPTLVPGERWNTRVMRGIKGRLTIKALEDASKPGTYLLDEDFSIPPDTFVEMNYYLLFKEKGVTDPNVPAFTDTRHIVGTGYNNDQIYYSPAAKELTSWTIAPLSIPLTGNDILVTVRDFMTNIQNTANPVRLVTPPDITELAMIPPQPKPGTNFLLTGRIGASNPTGTFVLADVLLPGLGGDTAFAQTNSSDRFSITLTAPTTRDLTPWVKRPVDLGDRETGSFGVRVMHFGVPGETVRAFTTLRTLAQNDVEIWNQYE